MDRKALIEKYNVGLSQKNNYLALKVFNGLGNRMRTYAFYKAVAKVLKRKFLLCWEKSIGFDDTTFNDLFENKETLITIEEFDEIRKKSINLNDFFQSTKCKQNEDFFKREYDPVQDKINVIRNIRECKFSIWEFSTPENKKIPLSIETANIIWPNFLGLENEFLAELRKLKINKNILSIINKISSSFTNSTCGMHIRKGDVLDKKNPDSKEYKESHDDNYFTEMMKELIKIDEKSTFYISTDCKKTFNKFVKLYKGRVIENTFKKYYKSEYNKEKSGQIDALIDMCCLAKTNKIFGTTWSTFSEVASRYGQVSLYLEK